MGQDFSSHLDRVIDHDPRFGQAVSYVFDKCDKRISGRMELYQLLGSAQTLLDLVANEVDTKLGALLLRAVHQEDVDAIIRQRGYTNSVDLEQFEVFCKELLKRMAIDKGQRLGLFMVGGVMAVHVLKGVVKQIPVVGGPARAIGGILFPTLLVGPALGICGALLFNHN